MILLLDHYDSFTYNLVQGLRVCGALVDVCEDTPNAIDLTGVNGVVLSPGPGHPDNTQAGYHVLAQAITKKLPVLGVCLGHQIIAQHFGAKVNRLPMPAHAQQCEITHAGDGLFARLDSPMQVGQYHSLQVENLPPVLKKTAQAANGVIMAFTHEDLPMYGVQFHPESVFTPHGQNILENFVNITQKPDSQNR